MQSPRFDGGGLKLFQIFVVLEVSATLTLPRVPSYLTRRQLLEDQAVTQSLNGSGVKTRFVVSCFGGSLIRKTNGRASGAASLDCRHCRRV